jgi:hypothetical protein
MSITYNINTQDIWVVDQFVIIFDTNKFQF